MQSKRHRASRPQPASRATGAAQTRPPAPPPPRPPRPPPPWPWRRPRTPKAAAAPFESSTPRWMATRRRPLGHRLAPLFAGVHVGWCARTGSAAAATTSARRPRAHLAARGARETHSPACEVRSGTRAISAKASCWRRVGLARRGGQGGRADRGCGTCDCCAAARLARAPLHVRCRAGAARRADITTRALGAGLLDVAAGISLFRGSRGNRADAAHQRAAPCDIEEAGTKWPGAKMRRAGFRASTSAPHLPSYGKYKT